MNALRYRNAVGGFTLLEMLVCMSAVSLLATISISMLVKVKNMIGTEQHQSELTMNLARLADSWRRDVATSKTAKIIDDHGISLFGDSGKEITYRSEDSGHWVTKSTSFSGGESRERFRIPPNAKIEFTVDADEDATPRWCSLSIHRQPTWNTETQRCVFHLSASLHSLPEVLVIRQADQSREVRD